MRSPNLIETNKDSRSPRRRRKVTSTLQKNMPMNAPCRMNPAWRGLSEILDLKGRPIVFVSLTVRTHWSTPVGTGACGGGDEPRLMDRNLPASHCTRLVRRRRAPQSAPRKPRESIAPTRAQELRGRHRGQLDRGSRFRCPQWVPLGREIHPQRRSSLSPPVPRAPATGGAWPRDSTDGH